MHGDLQAVEDAINAGIDRFSFDDRDRVKTAKKELRISDSLAKETLDTVARKAFLGFTTRSRGQRDRLEAAKELKKLVFFSNIVVAPLLEDLQVRFHPLLQSPNAEAVMACSCCDCMQNRYCWVGCADVHCKLALCTQILCTVTAGVLCFLYKQ